MDAGMVIEVLSGLVLPLLIAVVTRPGTDGRVKLALTIASAVFVGGVAEIAELGFNLTDLTPEGILASVGAVFMTSQAVFLTFRDRLGKVEAATTPNKEITDGIEDSGNG